MIDYFRNAFTELIVKTESLYFNHSQTSVQFFETLLKNIEDEYQLIQKKLIFKLEELKIIENIITNDLEDTDYKTTIDMPTKEIITEAIDEMVGLLFELAPQKLKPYYFNKGCWLYNQGEIRQALNAWENVLKVDPDNRYIHTKLKEIIGSGKSRHSA